MTRRGIWLWPVVVLAGDRHDPDLERKIEDLVNKEREARGLPVLKNDPRLRDAARRHSGEMDRRSFFSHVDPEQGDPSDRLNAAGIRWSAVGENIYQAGGIADLARSSVRGWMNSPGHRKNILSTRYTHAGVGVVEGRRRMVTITQMFAAFSA